MGFWTSQKIERHLDALITRSDGKEPSSEDVDCNAYTLRIGDEVYISPSEGEDDAPTRSIQQLKNRQSFSIPPGQFAFLTTDETVNIPTYAMAFISIKAGIKFRGLVNVSGFHVDPGYRDKIVFAVFNAGPRPVILRRGEPAFLIWFSDLSDDDTESPISEKNKVGKPGRGGLDGKTVGAIAGEIHSFQGLLGRMKESENKLIDRLHSIERDHIVLKWALTLIAGALITVIAKSFF